MLDGQRVADGTNHCYGLAFVLLAYAHASMAGVEAARAWIGETFDLMEHHFWSSTHGLYADEATPDWSVVSSYRGQNANMHACEALLAAFDATGDTRYLHRAEILAHNITVRQAGLADGLIWEHYRADWSVDWDYNRNDSSNLFRPWGFQPGHLAEWAKLLLTKPYPQPAAIQNVYELDVAKDPKMASVGPLEPWDLHYLREIDDSGFIDALYGL